MANTFLTIDMIAKEALMILRKNAVMAGLVHRDYSKEFVAGVGDTITIRKPATFTVKDFVESTGITVQDATEEKKTVKMDKFYDVSFAVTSKDLTMSISDFSAQLLTPAMMAFRDKIDAEIIKVAEGATHKVTHAQGKIAPDDIISVRKLLNDGATPLSMRSLVVGTQAEADLLSSELFISAEKVGSTEGLKEASLGRKFGFVYINTKYESWCFELTNGKIKLLHRNTIYNANNDYHVQWRKFVTPKYLITYIGSHGKKKYEISKNK